MRSVDFRVKLAWVFFASFVAAALAAFIFSGTDAVATEQGGIEVLSAAALLACLFLYCLHRSWTPSAWAGGLLLFFLLARELDLDKLPFRHGLLSLKLYTGDAVIWEKLIGLAIASLILLTVYRVIRTGALPLLRGLINSRSWAWLIMAALTLVVMAKTLDGVGRKLGGYGITISVSQTEMAQIIEETAELASALCLMLGIARLPQRQTQEQPRNPDGRTYSNRAVRDNHLDGARPGK